MICPKCGTEQPESAECARCGVLVAQYSGPSLGTTAFRPPGSSPPAGGETARPPLPPPPAGRSAGGVVYGAPPSATVVAPALGAFKGTFGMGEILGETFSIYFSNFAPFALLAALALSPIYLLEFLMVTMSPASAAASTSLYLLILGLSILAPHIATAAITFGVFQQMRGQDASVAECLTRGLSLLLPVLGLAVVQAFAIGLGAIACLIPGILIAVRWAVSIPAAVTEGTGVSASIERSTYLTDGLRMDIFGVLVVLGGLQIGLGLVVNLAAAKIPVLNLALSALKDLFIVGLSATGSAVIYYRLRGIKESIDVDQIASVFA